MAVQMQVSRLGRDATVKVSFDSEGGFLFVTAATTVTELDDLKKLGDLVGLIV